MSVVGGNPAKEFKKRQCVHKNLIVESLLGGDYKIYKETRKKWNHFFITTNCIEYRYYKRIGMILINAEHYIESVSIKKTYFIII